MLPLLESPESIAIGHLQRAVEHFSSRKDSVEIEWEQSLELNSAIVSEIINCERLGIETTVIRATVQPWIDVRQLPSSIDKIHN